MCCKQQKPRTDMMDRLGGWSFEPELYTFLVGNLPFGSTILELGSGAGTGVLAAHYTMYSIEHNWKFINRYKSTYILAPMVDYWYDRFQIEGKLPEKYDAILVDGPIGSESRNRIGFWENIDLFDVSKMIVIDDSNREGERMLFEKVLDYCNFDFATEQIVPGDQQRKFEHFNTFSVIYPAK